MAQADLSPIDASTRCLGVYGHPVHHSASPAMHQAAIGHLRLNWRYLAFDVDPNQLPAALEGARRMGFAGLNLTVPHKLLAVPLMDVCADSAREWGAVNTVVFEGQTPTGTWCPLGQWNSQPPPASVRLVGHNTDADAILKSLIEEFQLPGLDGLSVLLLGAGGAGRAAALKLASQPLAQLSLVNRTPDKALSLAREIQARHPNTRVHVGYPKHPPDLVVNATSLGLKPHDPSPLANPHHDLADTRFVYDMIYRPAETPLLAHARSRGCRTANGMGMLLHQGARAFELWSGHSAPIELMRQTLRSTLFPTAPA